MCVWNKRKAIGYEGDERETRERGGVQYAAISIYPKTNDADADTDDERPKQNYSPRTGEEFYSIIG